MPSQNLAELIQAWGAARGAKYTSPDLAPLTVQIIRQLGSGQSVSAEALAVTNQRSRPDPSPSVAPHRGAALCYRGRAVSVAQSSPGALGRRVRRGGWSRQLSGVCRTQRVVRFKETESWYQ